MDVPPSIDGPVLISASVLSGYEFGPGELNPYVQFQQLRPTTTIGRGIFVYDGHFDIPLASAMAHASTASRLAGEGHFDQALVEAQKAVVLAPNYVRAQDVLGNVLTRLNRPEEARQAFQRGVTAAQTIHPEYQGYWVPILREKIQSW
jgi:tetratricopeptide (TPR) repeat protein